jgi:hypothetical protein
MPEPLKWYEANADNPPWIKALAEVRQLAPREGWCYQHVQAIIVSIDQYAEAALGKITSPDRLADRCPGCRPPLAPDASAIICSIRTGPLVIRGVELSHRARAHQVVESRGRWC